MKLESKTAQQLGLQYYTLVDWRKLRKLKKSRGINLTEKEATKLISVSSQKKQTEKATKNGMNRNNSFVFEEAVAFIPRFAQQ